MSTRRNTFGRHDYSKGLWVQDGRTHRYTNWARSRILMHPPYIDTANPKHKVCVTWKASWRLGGQLCQQKTQNPHNKRWKCIHKIVTLCSNALGQQRNEQGSISPRMEHWDDLDSWHDGEHMLCEPCLQITEKYWPKGFIFKFRGRHCKSCHECGNVQIFYTAKTLRTELRSGLPAKKHAALGMSENLDPDVLENTHARKSFSSSRVQRMNGALHMESQRTALHPEYLDSDSESDISGGRIDIQWPP